MRSSGLCALLLSMYGITLPSYVPTQSGLFPFYFTTSEDHLACHECLVNSLGCTKLYLLQAGENVLLYWVEGHSEILFSFLNRCSTRRRCNIPFFHPTNHDKRKPKVAISQLSTYKRSYKGTEVALASLANRMPLEGSFLRPKEVDVDRKQKHSKLMLIKKVSISLFFGISLQQRARTIARRTSLGPISEKNLETNLHNLEDDTSIRCMIIPGPLSDDICRECLAMHSKWFAVRSYLLFYAEIKSSAELLVFPSNYESSDIVSNCRTKFCLYVISWNPSDCQIMDLIFPRHLELLMVHQKTYGQNKEQQIPNENTMDLYRMRQVLNVTAFARMQRASRASVPPHSRFSFSKTLEMLRVKEAICINVTIRFATKWECIGCILKNAGGARLVTILSLRNAMILTSDIKKRLDCVNCGNWILLEPDRCHQYRDESVVNIETFPMPSGFEVLDERVSNCFVLYYEFSRRMVCHRCMEIALKTKIDPYILTETSSLLDTSTLSSKLSISSFQNLLACHGIHECIRLQKVPYHFCSGHTAFLSSESSNSIGRDGIIKYTQEQIQVGVWPPQMHHVLMSHPKSGRMPNVSPVYSDRIALVQFSYAKSTFVDCANCLLEQTEVFFAYNDKSTSAGYVWMRPALSKILQICIGKRCSSLSYDRDRKQAERPVGIRQLTKSDIRVPI